MHAVHAQAENPTPSICYDTCIEAAQELGFEKVVMDSLACFLRTDGQQMGFTDCCNKVGPDGNLM
jgi:hypothetical protein